MKDRSRWGQDPVLIRTLVLWGGLVGPGERPSEDTTHTCRWTPEEVSAVPTLGPTRPSRGATRLLCAKGPTAHQLRSPWAESRRRVE